MLGEVDPTCQNWFSEAAAVVPVERCSACAAIAIVGNAIAANRVAWKPASSSDALPIVVTSEPKQADKPIDYANEVTDCAWLTLA